MLSLHCYLVACLLALQTMEEWRARDDLPPRDEHLLEQLVGHVIYYPDGFLSQTQLDTKAGEKEHYLPTAVKEKIVQ